MYLVDKCGDEHVATANVCVLVVNWTEKWAKQSIQYIDALKKEKIF